MCVCVPSNLLQHLVQTIIPSTTSVRQQLQHAFSKGSEALFLHLALHLFLAWSSHFRSPHFWSVYSQTNIHFWQSCFHQLLPKYKKRLVQVLWGKKKLVSGPFCIGHNHKLIGKSKLLETVGLSCFLTILLSPSSSFKLVHYTFFHFFLMNIWMWR